MLSYSQNRKAGTIIGFVLAGVAVAVVAYAVSQAMTPLQAITDALSILK
ncbi:MAG: hypothetical protein ACD_81C00025G0003 [uncultured bacterium]|uniref:Uncharacterized protein n=2 Tax=Candidatus Wolfeibacteriota TaxID=1752735 RepID=A0A0G1H5Q4_9BACT|nr:MAG: hypothetical protein ACD_81C00025G0003 [uncultured bacterium]KKR13036.1 MAG: hypothetical protein UT41_C0001G0580 [Candidatus Wolfebacteria bacterium GW2011_GWC2_39_22]KKT42706.1 MAG: hypothetical protein UW32_C0004G0011 [Candidatus Wolfebacteria bacterium GW2011_GWE2_44_13]